MAAAGAVFMALGTVASAQAFVMGGKIFATGGDVEVTFLPGSAGFTSELRLFTADKSQFISIGTNTEIGKVANLGSFAAGQELLFGIYVQNTGNTFFMGEAARNADNIVHNIVDEIAPGVINVGFEDLFRGGDFDFDDVRYQFRGGIDDTPTTSVPVPEPASVLGILALGSVGVASMLKRKQQKKATVEA